MQKIRFWLSAIVLVAATGLFMSYSVYNPLSVVYIYGSNGFCTYPLAGATTLPPGIAITLHATDWAAFDCQEITVYIND